MSLILPGNVASALPTGFNVDNSCRFNDGDSAYIYRDLGTSTAGSGKKFTFSVWVKRSTITNADQFILSCGVAASNHLVDLFFQSDDTLKFRLIYNNTLYGNLTTNAVYRDTASWMHIVINMDTTQGTAADRTSMYVNGTKITSFSASTRPNQDSTFTVNNHTVNSQRISLGRNEDGTTGYFDGYMAEAIWIDGTTYAASNFGEYDEDSPQIWIPKDCKDDLTFGTHGSYLNFQDSGDLDDDECGNGLDFTATNLAATDQMTDSPTNNACTMNPLDNHYGSQTYSEGNLQIASPSGNASSPHSTFGLTSGMWYAEAKLSAQGANQTLIGISSNQSTQADFHLGRGATSYGLYSSSGAWYTNNGSANAYGVSYTTNDIIGIYLDLDNNKLYFAKNGTIMNSGTGISITDPASTELGFYFFSGMQWDNATSATWQWNFGGGSINAISSGNTDANGYGNFEYDPSDGGSSSFDSAAKNFLAVNSKNLGSDGG